MGQVKNLGETRFANPDILKRCPKLHPFIHIVLFCLDTKKGKH